MISLAARRWIEAAKVLSVDAGAVVRCPERDDGVLLVRDVRPSTDAEAMERILSCPACGAWNAMRMRVR